MSSSSTLARLFSRVTELVDRKVGWDKLPLPIGLAVLIGVRDTMRQRNLHDTEALPATEPRPLPTPDGTRYQAQRTADGTFNDLQSPLMGSAGMRFGRNVPHRFTFPEPMPRMLEPNPRDVSLQLMTRERFIPATGLNVHAAAWLQFMIRDWFSHGKSPKEDPWQLPLRDNDDWPARPMTILRVRPDPRQPADTKGSPPTYANTESHWWDASQVYGSNAELQKTVRSGKDGKLTLPDGMIPAPLLQRAGEEPGWWLGLAMLHTLFAREHNAICDRLKLEYPGWSDEDLFQKARLVNAALLAKIHTVEWTPAVISHPTTVFALRGNWWGLQGERLTRAFGRLTHNEIISGIPGSPTDHHTAPYVLTEEFVAVYRMHPLVPDDFSFRNANTNRSIEERTFKDVNGKAVQPLLGAVPLQDLFYSFGTEHPGAITLHNFPKFLQRFERPDGVLVDLAATDILRSRELGVPRYNQFRRLINLNPANSFDEMTDNPAWAEELRRVYGDPERVDLTVGMFAEPKPTGFGFSDTAFRIFILMASRRLKSDRYFTTDFTPQVYTQTGLDWIADNSMVSVILRHFPALGPSLRGVNNAFVPWSKADEAR